MSKPEELEEFSTAEILMKTAFVEGQFYSTLSLEEREVDYLTSVLFFDYDTDKTDVLLLFDPDSFAEEINEMLEHARPIAVEICVDDEDTGYPNAWLEFIAVEPSIEDQAILAGTFEIDEKALLGRPKISPRPLTRKVTA